MNLIRESIRVHYPHFDFKIRGKIAGIRFPCFADIKYDGKLVTIIKKDESDPQCTIVTTTERHTMVIQNAHFIHKKGIYLAEWIAGVGRWDTLKYVTTKQFQGTSFRIFDVLSAEGVDVSEKDLLTRKEIVCHSVSTEFVSSSDVIQSDEQLNLMFLEVTKKYAYEGLVVKNFDETFLGQTWVKMKPPERMNHGSTTGGN